MLDRVLINFGNDPEQLFLKLSGLARSWGESGNGETVFDQEVGGHETGEAPLTSQQKVAREEVRLSEVDIILGKFIAQYLEELAHGCRDLWPDLARNVGTCGR